PTSSAEDQVLLVARRDQLVLEPAGGWNALGMRGTCSLGYHLTATVSPDAVLPDDYATILAESMGPACHVLWAAAWLGIARSSVDAARRFVQAAARKSIDTVPPGAAHLVGLVAELQAFESLVRDAAHEFTLRADNRIALSSIGYAVSVNNLKVTASTLVTQIVAGALRITGISGYRNDGPYTVARNFRDAHGAAVMVSNDRIIAHNARLVLMQKGS
ncbi:MAG: acyl-CoA dehydrogenase family protein, partial [Rhodoglobus sp.]|nr:acyl-CoA dehydrogenase family protein [Rhodoglobus sp.]